MVADGQHPAERRHSPQGANPVIAPDGSARKGSSGKQEGG